MTKKHVVDKVLSAQLRAQFIEAFIANDNVLTADILSSNKLTSEDLTTLTRFVLAELSKANQPPKSRELDPKYDTLQIVTLGDFTVSSGQLIVTDPCYEKGTWCQGILTNVKNGLWEAFTGLKRQDGWGVRNQYLRVAHKNFLDIKCDIKSSIDVGVDSGQAGFFDLAKYPEGESREYGDKDSFYGQVCALTLNEEGVEDHPGAGVLEFGAVSSSGFGDGSYSCHYAKDNNEIVAAEIVFISEDEEAEDE